MVSNSFKPTDLKIGVLVRTNKTNCCQDPFLHKVIRDSGRQRRTLNRKSQQLLLICSHSHAQEICYSYHVRSALSRRPSNVRAMNLFPAWKQWMEQWIRFQKQRPRQHGIKCDFDISEKQLYPKYHACLLLLWENTEGNGLITDLLPCCKMGLISNVMFRTCLHAWTHLPVAIQVTLYH